jgi:hypothetical protein
MVAVEVGGAPRRDKRALCLSEAETEVEEGIGSSDVGTTGVTGAEE